MKLTLGADIGGTNSRVGAVTENGEILAHATFATNDYPDANSFADKLAQACRSVMQSAEKTLHMDATEWVGLGIGAPNSNYHTGMIEEPPNLPFKGSTPLVALLKERLGLKNIKTTNDANAAAIGEKKYGAAKDFSDFIMITLGTGLGSGIFVNDRLVYGHDGFAGEMGHITIMPEGRYCGFARRGSLETYCSATGIRRTFFEMLALHGKATTLHTKTIGEISSKDIAEAAQNGDFISKETYRFTGTLLGQAMASVALITSPAAFFLFGGPVKAGSILLDPVKEAFEKHLIPTYKNKIQIIRSELPMGEAAILGAAALVTES